MKKILLVVALVLGLTIPAISQAQMSDMGLDVYNCHWYARHAGTDISRNGVTYQTIVIEVYMYNSAEARAFYEVGPECYAITYVRVVDCKGLRFAGIARTLWNHNKEKYYTSPVLDEWDWITLNPSNNTKMLGIARRFCGTL